MQINGTASGPTMAASEPPEPPPRNPDRINASLHKLSESKNIKSLDSSNLAGPNERIGSSNNNNRPLKTIQSLDNAICSANLSAASAPNAASATTTSTGPANRSVATSAATTGACNNIVQQSAAATAQPAAVPLSLAFQKRPDIGTGGTCPPTAAASDTQSPLSSNGSSNHTLVSPMTIDNQLQQQQQRLTYHLNKSDSQHCQLMPQQPPANGGSAQRVAGLIINEQQQQAGQQQLINGCLNNGLTNVSGGSAAVASTAVGASGTSPLNANISANHINLQNSAVDKRNANDVCSIVKLMDLGASTTPKAQRSPPHKAATMAATSALSNSCDSNRNNDDEPLKQQQQQQQSAQTLSIRTAAAAAADSPTKLREENERLAAELARLRKLLENSPEGAVGGVDLSDSNSCGDAQSTDGSGGTPQQRVDRLEAELRSSRSQLMSLRIERKKLRSDKHELLGQVKQLCSSLQEKEQELRDFIRNYQERVRESDANNAKLTGDRERERWQLLKQARDEAERSLALAQQLNARDMQLQRLQEQLQEARRQMSGCLSDQESLLSFAPLTPPSAASGLLNQMAQNSGQSAGLRTDDSGRGNSLSAFSGSSGATVGDRNSCSNDSVLRNSSDRESTGGDLNFSEGNCDSGPCITVDPDSISLVSSQNMYQYGTPKDRSPTLSPLNSAAYSRSVEQLGSPVDSDGPGAISRKFATKTCALGARNGRGGTWGSISRVFARSRNKSKAMSADGASEYTDYSWSPLSEEGYAEKLRLLREASQMPMERWRATQVLAWLEVALGMPQYSSRCAENVKSGKVLLELSDTELEAGLGLAHPMHRKKLRLAIEEQRRPELVRYPMITQLGHTWVASEWLPDIGLPQYAESFIHSLVDARMLDTLSKKELEKFLGVTRKFHQASIVHGIHVLRIVKYDRQTLAMRRVQSETVDTDPIVWTNQRFIRWAKSIDLGEYADNLKDSGVHGGLVVLEPSFSGDTMATALGIPPSKNIIRRHLTTEFDTLILPARATLGQGIRSGGGGIVPLTGPGGLQHYATTDRRSSSGLRISAWKGSQSSLSKTFRFNAKPSRSGSSIGDRTSFGNSTSPTPSYSSSEGGGGIYATIGGMPLGHHAPPHYPPPTCAPPPPPTGGLPHHHQQQQQQQQHYGQTGYAAAPPGHRVSAPPVSSLMDDTQLLYEQHRRVKSISDIGSGSGSGGSVGGVAASGSGLVDPASCGPVSTHSPA